MELQTIQNRIYELRGHRIMLDYDLAALYGTETKHLKQAVRRNLDRFPDDFMFKLSLDEYKVLRSQFVTSKQITRGGNRYLPFAFTEQGVAMLSSILNSKKAIQMNIAIMRAFVYIRQYALVNKDLSNRLTELETKYNRQFKDVYEAINYLMQKDTTDKNQQQRKRIGFQKS